MSDTLQSLSNGIYVVVVGGLVVFVSYEVWQCYQKTGEFTFVKISECLLGNAFEGAKDTFQDLFSDVLDEIPGVDKDDADTASLSLTEPIWSDKNPVGHKTGEWISGIFGHKHKKLKKPETPEEKEKVEKIVNTFKTIMN